MSDFTKWVEAWDAYRNAGLPVKEHRELPLSPRLHWHSRKHSLGIVPFCLPRVRHPHGHLHCVVHTGHRLPCRIVPYARPLRDGTRTGRIRHTNRKNLGIGVHRLRREPAPTAPPHPTSNAPSTGTIGASTSPSTRTTATGSACTTRMAKR